MLDILERLDRVLVWAGSKNYHGYSKFDAFNNRLNERLIPKNKKIRAVTAALWARQPISLRRLLNTEQPRNPKGIALFALAYLRKFRVFGRAIDLDTALSLLKWLEDNANRNYSGPCWGYDHDWYGLHFHVRKHEPNIVVTGNVAYAFCEAYEVTGDEKYLSIAKGVSDFMLNDLERPIDEPEMRNIGYVPCSRWGVLNINGLASAILIRVWRYTKEEKLKDEARRLMAFLVDKQTDYGAWHYAWPADTSNVKHDNYHTGNVLDWVLDYTSISGDSTHLENYRRGIEFYRRELFLADGAPKWMSHKVYPFDVHSAAQGIVTMVKAAVELDESYMADAEKTAAWSCRQLQSRNGYFYYQKGRFWTKKYTLMRWCNAWMAFALASLLFGRKILGERKLENAN